MPGHGPRAQALAPGCTRIFLPPGPAAMPLLTVMNLAPRTHLLVLATATLLAPHTPLGAAEKSTLDAVRAELSTDGQLYTTIDFEGGWARVGAQLDEALAGTTEQPLHVARFFETLGLSNIGSVGMSSRAVPGGYDNRLFIHTPGGRRGLFTVFPGEPAPFTGLTLAPADTDLFVEVRLDLGALVDMAVHTLGQSLDDDTLLAAFKGELAELEEPFRSLAQFRGSLVAIARMSPDDPDGESVVPPVEFLFRLDALGPVVAAMLENKGTYQRSEDNGVTTFAAEDGMFIAIEGDAVFGASSAAFLAECRGAGAGLNDNPAVRSLLADTAAEGHSLTYATPRLFNRARNLFGFGDLLRSGSSGLIDSSDALALTQVLSALPEMTEPMASVLVARHDGILIRERSVKSNKAALPIVAALTPDFLGEFALQGARAFASMTARSRASELARKALEPDLQRIADAAHAYFAAHEEEEFVTFSTLREQTDGADLPALDDVVDGEIEIARRSDLITAHHREHGEIRHVIPLTDAQRSRIEENLRALDAAAAHYFARESASTVYAGSLAGSGNMEPPVVVAGEDYDYFSIDDSSSSLSVTTAGGQEVSVERDTSLVLQARRRIAEQRYAIEQILARIDAAARTYLEANPEVGVVDTATLVSSGAIVEPTPIAGESYDNLYLSSSVQELSVESEYAGTVTFTRPLDPATRKRVSDHLNELGGLATDYFRTHPDAVLVLAAELLPADRLVVRGPEDDSGWEPDAIPTSPELRTLIIRRDATRLAVALEGGHTVDVPLGR